MGHLSNVGNMDNWDRAYSHGPVGPMTDAQRAALAAHQSEVDKREDATASFVFYCNEGSVKILKDGRLIVRGFGLKEGFPSVYSELETTVHCTEVNAALVAAGFSVVGTRESRYDGTYSIWGRVEPQPAAPPQPQKPRTMEVLREELAAAEVSLSQAKATYDSVPHPGKAPIPPVPGKITVEKGPRGVQIVVWEKIRNPRQGEDPHRVGPYSRKGWISPEKKAKELAYWVEGAQETWAKDLAEYKAASSNFTTAVAEWESALSTWKATEDRLTREIHSLEHEISALAKRIREFEEICDEPRDRWVNSALNPYTYVD